jgi:hypothetical protein
MALYLFCFYLELIWGIPNLFGPDVDLNIMAPQPDKRLCHDHRTGARSGLFRLGFVSFTISAWINNTPIVALFSPIVREWARARGYAPSLFLIPLCYAVTLGGLCTSIGTSTNLGEYIHESQR